MNSLTVALLTTRHVPNLFIDISIWCCSHPSDRDKITWSWLSPGNLLSPLHLWQSIMFGYESPICITGASKSGGQGDPGPRATPLPGSASELCLQMTWQGKGRGAGRPPTYPGWGRPGIRPSLASEHKWQTLMKTLSALVLPTWWVKL